MAKRRSDSGGFETAARAALSAREASEIVRRYQQGFGRPIISVEMNGFRLIAVGKTIKWSKGWLFFTDFLLDHLKDAIGRPWAIQAQREGKTHPIFTWLGTMNEIAAKNRAVGPGPFQSSCKGHLGALWRLGYALYLIEHNDALDAKIIKRLRSPVSFRATYHETQIASAFAVSGFAIKMAEIGRTSSSAPRTQARFAKSVDSLNFRLGTLANLVDSRCMTPIVFRHLSAVGQVERQLELQFRDRLLDDELEELPHLIDDASLQLFGITSQDTFYWALPDAVRAQYGRTEWEANFDILGRYTRDPNAHWRDFGLDLRCPEGRGLHCLEVFGRQLVCAVHRLHPSALLAFAEREVAEAA